MVENKNKIKFLLIKLNLYRIETFNHVSTWLNDAKIAARKDSSICLVGNKSDLKNLRQVSYNEAAKFSQNNSTNVFLYYYFKLN